MENLVEKGLKDLVPSDYASKLKKLKKLQKEIQTMEKSFKDELKNSMHQYNVIEISVDDVKFRYVAESTKPCFDEAKFKEEHEDLYVQYQTTKTTSDYIRTTI